MRIQQNLDIPHLAAEKLIGRFVVVEVDEWRSGCMSDNMGWLNEDEDEG